MITAAGTAVHWQSRVAYYWYKKVQKQCEVGLWVWVGTILMCSQNNALRVRCRCGSACQVHSLSTFGEVCWAEHCGIGSPSTTCTSHWYWVPMPAGARQLPDGRLHPAAAHGPAGRSDECGWLMLTDRPSTGAVDLLQMQGGLYRQHSKLGSTLPSNATPLVGTLWLQEIPTWVAQPLPPEHPDHGWAECLASASITMRAGLWLCSMHARLRQCVLAGLRQCSVHACCCGVAGRLVLCQLGGSVPRMPAPSLPLVLHSSSATTPSTCAATLCSTGRTRCCSGSRQ